MSLICDRFEHALLRYCTFLTRNFEFSNHLLKKKVLMKRDNVVPSKVKVSIHEQKPTFYNENSNLYPL